MFALAGNSRQIRRSIGVKGQNLDCKELGRSEVAVRRSLPRIQHGAAGLWKTTSDVTFKNLEILWVKAESPFEKHAAKTSRRREPAR
jgi:hypothetical protein